MKKLFYYSIIALAALAASNKIIAQNANTTLSNLTTPTKVNVNLLPDNNNKYNLGSATKGWKNLYLDTAVYLGGTKFLTGNASLHNTGVGLYALYYNTTGRENTANGYDALYYNTMGWYNTANGLGALSPMLVLSPTWDLHS
jgi:trimeric autotransporter adhesin